MPLANRQPRQVPSATVFLVDDDPSVQRALTRLIKSAGYHVRAFASAREFLDSDWRNQRMACLVSDIRMPGLSGIDLQSELHRSDPILPIIFITGHGDIPTSVKAMKAGAIDFLEKPLNDKVLLMAIDQALARAARNRSDHEELEGINNRIHSLTPRERQVMSLIVTGMLNKQVAYELGTVEKTVKVHRAKVMEKMQVDSLAQLVRLAERAGIGKT